MTRPHAITVPNQPARRAFTLVELMVVIMIIAILSSLTLAGLSGVRQRAREDKTKSTIRKIDAVIRPMYDSYRTRRVQASGISRVMSNRRFRSFSIAALRGSSPAATCTRRVR